MSGKTMKLTLKVWRQKNASAPGRFVTYDAPNVSPDMSFLELLDVVNEDLIHRDEEPLSPSGGGRAWRFGMCPDGNAWVAAPVLAGP